MSIFTHAVLGTNNLDQATKFYDATLGTLKVKNMGPLGENGVMYGTESPEFIITKPANGEPACHANGGTLGFAATTRDEVHKFHEVGLANGGTDEGQPGPREFSPTAYASYLRDPDGNKICTYTFAEE
jgi:catechol 2,3-dioxygenase-like lactoylglutathione lyase family enzyme